jgi:hypothetical protein
MAEPVMPTADQSLPGAMRQRIAALIGSVRRRLAGRVEQREEIPALVIAGYNLVLMDPDGQVVWSHEWDVSGFEFGPRWDLWVFCQYTNHAPQEMEIAEYEIELVSGEERSVVKRFGDSFADSVVVAPGQSKLFSGRWRL